MFSPATEIDVYPLLLAKKFIKVEGLGYGIANHSSMALERAMFVLTTIG